MHLFPLYSERQGTIVSRRSANYSFGISSIWQGGLEANELVRTDASPTAIRVIESHFPCNLCRIRAQIPFVNHAMLIDDEGFYARRAINRWKRHDAKAVGHLAVDDIVMGAAMSMRTLLSED